MALKPKILLAHFDPSQIERLKETLERCGAEVSVQRDGQAALASATSARPRIALLATLLPGLNGFEVCRRLHQGGGAKWTSVILLTDVDDPYVRARARHVGAKRVMVEPLDEAKVRELLEMPWEEIDPLEISSRRKFGRGNELMADLMSTSKGDPGLLAKVTDPLTGLVSEEYFLLKQEEELKRACRYRQPLSMLMVEISNFESVVKLHGKRAGDEAILEVAGVFLCESRDVDIAGRISANRFDLLLPNTPDGGAHAVAVRVAEALSGRILALDDEEVMLSTHLATVTCSGENVVTQQEFNEQAIEALGRAARKGLSLGGKVQPSSS